MMNCSREGSNPVGIRLRGVSLQMANKALANDLDLEVEAGEFLAIAGPSGSGKTSLLRAMAGLLQPLSGCIRWSGSAVGVNVGFVYQHLRLPLGLTALTAVCTGRLGCLPVWQTILGFPREVQFAAYQELRQFGLSSAAHQRIATLSGGERQRVAVARTLFQQPDIYFLDEPVANLDRANAQLLLNRLRREVNESGRTVVTVLHDDAQISLFADRVLRWDHQAACQWRIEPIRSRHRSFNK